MTFLAEERSILSIVWSDKSSRNNEILLVTSIDEGKTFGNMINLSNNAGFSEAPVVAVSKVA